MARSKTLHGASVLVYINGALYGRVQGFTFSAVTQNKEIQTIDVQEALELASQRVSVKCTMMVVRTIGDGGVEGAALVPRPEDLSYGKYFSVTLRERITQTTIFQADYCTLDNQSWGIMPKSLMTGTISFSALTYSNEVIPDKAI